MKKVAVLVLAMLALAGLTTLAYADLDVYKDSWVNSYPSMWMGSAQANYGSDPSLHSITYTTVNVGGADGNVASFAYDMSKETWAGEVVQQGGGGTATVDLSAYTQLKFKVAKPVGGQDVVVQKFTMTDGNGIEHATAAHTVSTTDFSDEITIDLTGINLSAVNNLWGFIVTQADNGGGTGTRTFYVDDVRYVGGNKGEVVVKVTGGKRGIAVMNRINFGSVAAGSNTNSATLSGDKWFEIRNIGDAPTSSETVSLDVVNPGGWTAVTTEARPLVNRYVLAAVFNTTSPLPGDGTFILPDDALTTTPAFATASKFAGNANGMNITPYSLTGDARYMFLRFYAPDQTSSNAETKLYVEVGF